MPKYRKKPVVIIAVQWEGDEQGAYDIQRWINDNSGQCSISAGGIAPPTMNIKTLEGVMRVDPRDLIIQGVKGEFYPCKPDIFAATYDLVSDA